MTPDFGTIAAIATAPGEAGPGPEGVAAVVAAADEQDDTAAVDAAEELGAGGGETGRGPLHQGAVRQPCHQGPFGGPDRLHVVRSTHAVQSSPCGGSVTDRTAERVSPPR